MKARIKTLEEILKIEGVENYRDTSAPGIVGEMVEMCGKKFDYKITERGYYYINSWSFRQERVDIFEIRYDINIKI